MVPGGTGMPAFSRMRTRRADLRSCGSDFTFLSYCALAPRRFVSVRSVSWPRTLVDLLGVTRAVVAIEYLIADGTDYVLITRDSVHRHSIMRILAIKLSVPFDRIISDISAPRRTLDRQGRFSCGASNSQTSEYSPAGFVKWDVRPQQNWPNHTHQSTQRYTHSSQAR